MAQPVLIRAIRHDDRERIIAAFRKLEPETVYTRFFSAKKELTETDLARIDASDFVHAAALVATVGDGDDEVIIGAGGYTVLDRPGEPPTAEVSFTIEEDYQGQGLSGLFMRLLTQIARERGIRASRPRCWPATWRCSRCSSAAACRRTGTPRTASCTWSWRWTRRAVRAMNPAAGTPSVAGAGRDEGLPNRVSRGHGAAFVRQVQAGPSPHQARRWTADELGAPASRW